MRRRLALSLALGTLLALVPATAQAGDVSEMLEETMEAEFHGTGVILCTWGSETAATTYSMTRADGMTMVEGPGGSLLSYEGMAASSTGGDWYGTEIEDWAAWSVSDRYTIDGETETDRLGRPAILMVLLEDGIPRVRMVVDAVSKVPLSTEILDSDGGVYRMAVLLTFDPGAGEMPEIDMPEVEMMGTVRPMTASGAFPDTLAGYLRADVYGAGNDAVQAFYTDGVFAFSVFEAPRGGRPAAFEEATEFETGGNRYRRILTPTSVWVHWDAPDRSYVLVGDLPPDHLVDVLNSLPAPGNRGFLVRLWRSLFG